MLLILLSIFGLALLSIVALPVTSYRLLLSLSVVLNFFFGGVMINIDFTSFVQLASLVIPFVIAVDFVFKKLVQMIKRS